MSSSKNNKPVVKPNTKSPAALTSNKKKVIKVKNQPANKPVTSKVIRLVSSNNVWPD